METLSKKPPQSKPCSRCRDREAVVRFTRGNNPGWVPDWIVGWWCLPCLELVAPNTAKLVRSAIGTSPAYISRSAIGKCPK